MKRDVGLLVIEHVVIEYGVGQANDFPDVPLLDLMMPVRTGSVSARNKNSAAC
jgi:hypothetical protein